MVQPMFYAILQGTTVLTIGGNRFALSAAECAATSFGLPFIGQLENATPQSPYIAIRLDLDIDLLTNVMFDMPNAEDRWVCSAARGTLDGSVGDAFARLVRLLAAPEDRAVLGRHCEIELYYRLLQSPMGDTLRQLGRHHDRSRQIKTAADRLCANADKPVAIPQVAASVGMSVTSFHRHFKTITGYSPLAFQRQVRLLAARRRLSAGGISISQVAYAAGYASPSQFSREYKYLFGVAPSADLARGEQHPAA
jgi:AraC-like DNA-binding protein